MLTGTEVEGRVTISMDMYIGLEMGQPAIVLYYDGSLTALLCTVLP